MNDSFDSQFESPGDSVLVGRTSVGSAGAAARAGVVNRTHRVVRQRAQVMQARRSHLRGLMLPLMLCSVLLILTMVAVWSGLYQFDVVGAAEAVQADVAALADANNLVVLLWFVPVSIVFLGTLLIRRARGNATSHETVR